MKKSNNITMCNILLLLVLFLLPSCISEKLEHESKATYITIQTRASTHPGTSEDHVISSLRLMMFDKVTGICTVNELKTPTVPGQFDQLVKAGTYHLVIVANEPESLAGVGSYLELTNKTIPAKYFTSAYFGIDGQPNDVNIPMSVVVKDIEIKADGRYVVNGITQNKGVELEVKLTRLAVRMDITLMSTKEFSLFKDITISRLPESVPLLTDVVNTASRSGSRTIEFSDFVDVPMTSQETAAGIKWKKKLSPRVIFPSSLLAAADKLNLDKSVLLTVNFNSGVETPRSVPLDLVDIDPAFNHRYSLPPNSYLTFEGTIKDKITLESQVQDWSNVSPELDIPGIRVLNVSHTSIALTDLNGVRVSFFSNMPRVRVLESCSSPTGRTSVTNTEFNDLANPTLNADGTYSTTRFYYNPATGEGYMDVLVDGGPNHNGKPRLEAAGELLTNGGSQDGTYTLTLVADDGKGGSPLKRQITAEVTQLGIRFYEGTYPGDFRYMGAFFKNSEKGERIITGQAALDKEWVAWVPYANEGGLYNKNDDWQDWIVLSSTPSFDPGVGTENPGEAENFLVTPNTQKGESSRRVKGKGRIYFRIGIKDGKTLAPSAAPQYFVIRVQYYATTGSLTYANVYVRQGHNPDYIYTNTAADQIGTLANINTSYQPLRGQNRTKAVKFSPYNLTAPSYRSGGNGAFEQLAVAGGTLTQYPSQAGAFFQYGLREFSADRTTDINRITPYYRRAYHPDNRSTVSPNPTSAAVAAKSRNSTVLYPQGTSGTDALWYVMWGKTDPTYGVNTSFEDRFETCPPGYRRPTDGDPSERVEHLPADLADSEFRQSLFKFPFSGDANSNAYLPTIWSSTNDNSGTYAKNSDPLGGNGRKNLPATARSFYADGFFDRRPIHRTTTATNANNLDYYCVSPGTAQVAHVGMLFWNERTWASIFFPGSGRMDNIWATYQARGGTGYYWSSTPSVIRSGPEYQDGDIDKRANTAGWTMEIKYDFIMPRSSYADFSHSIRCVLK